MLLWTFVGFYSYIKHNSYWWSEKKTLLLNINKQEPYANHSITITVVNVLFTGENKLWSRTRVNKYSII